MASRRISLGWLLAITFAVANSSPACAQQSAKDQLADLEAADGLRVGLFAAEPMVVNPAAIDVDTDGRVWVAEIQHYRRAAEASGGDKIKVLEDTDADGVADRVTVFADGVFCPMSICVAGDHVYVATSPDLWVYRDENHDLKADGPPVKLLTGFGGYNHDHGAHSLVLGPDHKWWMSHGDGGFDVRGTDGSRIAFEWGAMLRGELDGSQLETVAVNFRNPYEIAVSSTGESFCSDNDNDGNFSVRICWIMEGGDYGWFGRPPAKIPPGTPFAEGWHFRAHVPGYVPGTLVTGFGSPAGICLYEGGAFDEAYRDVLFHADAGPGEVRVYRHRPEGAGYRATAEVVLRAPNDKYFRPIDVCAAPDGNLYVADWYDGGVGGHAYNNPDQGRIFVLRPSVESKATVAPPGPYENLAEAVLGLGSPNLATQFLAREFLLSDPQSSVPALEELVGGDDDHLAARAMWLLDRIGGAARDRVVAELDSDDGSRRALAVRILRRHGDEYGELLLALADDPEEEVRREVLLAMRNIHSAAKNSALERIARAYEGDDRYLLEAIKIAATDAAGLFAALRSEETISAARAALAMALDRDAASAWMIEALGSTTLDWTERAPLLELLTSIPTAQSVAALLELASDDQADPRARRASLEGLRRAADSGGAYLRNSKQLRDRLKQMLVDELARDVALAMVESLGVGGLEQQVLALAGETSAPASLRVRAIRLAATKRPDDVARRASDWLSDSQATVRDAAVDALLTTQNQAALRDLFADKSRNAARVANAARRAMANTTGALVMLRMFEAEELHAPLRDVVLAAAVDHPDANVRALFERHVPENKRAKRLGETISSDALLALEGDAARGSDIFHKSSAAQCNRCHTVRGRGGDVGPELTQIGRKYDRRALLETILDPSRAIAPEYVPHVLETVEGRVLAGFVVQNDDQRVVLKDIEGRTMRVAAEDVAVLEPQSRSLMPELVLRDVTAQDAADLLAYLVDLKDAVQQVGRFRVLGPFPLPKDGTPSRGKLSAEELASPNLDATYLGLKKTENQWDVVTATDQNGLLSVDQVAYCRDRGLRTDRVRNWFLVFADSRVAQPATLDVRSDDDCRVWVGGAEVHRHQGSRAITTAGDRVKVQLAQGRNPIVIQVDNRNGPGGVALAIQCESFLQLTTE